MPTKRVHGFTGPLSKQGLACGDTPDVVPSLSARFRAPGLLLLGSLSAFFAFLGSAQCTIMEFFKEKYRWSLILGVPFASGNGYWPETVSESVSDADSAAGKIFFTFCLLAGIALFMSWYPFNLRNVYTGPATVPFDVMYWTTFRQYVPVVGLFMLIGVSVYPSKVAVETNGGMVCLCIHLTGAAMMFLGYMFSEFACLGMFGITLPKKIGKKYLDIEGMEYCLRKYFIFCMFVAYVVFCLFEVLMVIQNPCCADDWVPEGTWYNRTTDSGVVSWHILSKATVSNTASGMYLLYKFGAYFGECVAGVFLILSHLTIWWYCEERHVRYGDSILEMVYDQNADGQSEYSNFGETDDDIDEEEGQW